MSLESTPKTKHALAEENRLLREIIEHVPCGVTANTAEGDFVLINAAAAEINALDRDVVMNQNDKEVFARSSLTFEDGGGSDGMWLNYVVSNSGEPVVDVPITYSLPDGTKKYTVMSVYPVKTDGRTTSTFCIANDLQHSEQMANIVEKYTHLKSPNRKSGSSFATRYTFDDFLTVDKDTLACVQSARRAANIDLPCMIIGETGTGKEIIAQGMHRESAAADGPFVPINCAAVPEGLVESIFFGSVKGAFTGATDMAGLFEQANGGTLFLDEVNSLPLTFQAKLLRTLQEKRVRRVGATKETPFDCRIISASNVDLTENSTWDTFRRDLFYRLAVVTVHIPALRNRHDDVLVLAKNFISRYENAVHHYVVGLSPEVEGLFLQLDWPGNVRELQNVIASSMSVMDESDAYIEMRHLPTHYLKKTDTAIEPPPRNVFSDGEAETPQDTNPDAMRVPALANELEYSTTLDTQLDDYERQVIEQALQRHNGNVTRAAEELAVSRASLYAKMKKLNINKPR